MSPLPLDALIAGYTRLLGQAMREDEARAWLEQTSGGDNISASIAVAAAVAREAMTTVSVPAKAIDVCGTGGDGKHTLNVSTAVAIVAAACGVPVAKHGNRAATSLAGGADTLEALGLDLDAASARATMTLDEIGIAFLFAQKHHPALKALAPIRKAIPHPTVLNYIGPLCNPGRVRRQLVGVANLDVFAHFTRIPWGDVLGMERVIVVCGDEGLDEISISGPSHIFDTATGQVTSITPEEVGLPRHPLAAIRGGDAAYNADALRRLLMGEHGAYRDAVLLNSAAALVVAGEVDNWRDGVEEAAEALDKGLAKALLDCWIAATR